jgi:hypothetical protein
MEICLERKDEVDGAERRRREKKGRQRGWHAKPGRECGGLRFQIVMIITTCR